MALGAAGLPACGCLGRKGCVCGCVSRSEGCGPASCDCAVQWTAARGGQIPTPRRPMPASMCHLLLGRPTGGLEGGRAQRQEKDRGGAHQQSSSHVRPRSLHASTKSSRAHTSPDWCRRACPPACLYPPPTGCLDRSSPIDRSLLPARQSLTSSAKRLWSRALPAPAAAAALCVLLGAALLWWLGWDGVGAHKGGLLGRVPCTQP